MFELSPSTAVVIYLGITLSVLILIWGYTFYMASRRPRPPLERILYLCEYCLCVYLDQSDKKVSQCPQCHCFNKENRYKKR